MAYRLMNSFALAAMVAAQLAFAPLASAQSSEAILAAQRGNISGRQRMLAQRISKAACFLHVGISSNSQLGQMEDAIAQFEANLLTLQSGNDALGLNPERDLSIFGALEGVSNEWDAFLGQLQAVLNDGVVGQPALAEIDSIGLHLMERMNNVVNQIARTYGDKLSGMPLIMSRTMDIAGRQRMFTQKAAKEFCLIEAGVNVEENRTRLAKTAELFTLTLGALQSGMPGMVMAAPNDEIRDQLRAVAEAWIGPKAALEAAANGETITDAQRNAVANDMERVLVLMNEAVGMYEEAIPK